MFISYQYQSCSVFVNSLDSLHKNSTNSDFILSKLLLEPSPTQKIYFIPQYIFVPRILYTKKPKSDMTFQVMSLELIYRIMFISWALEKLVCISFIKWVSMKINATIRMRQRKHRIYYIYENIVFQSIAFACVSNMRSKL